MNTQLEVNGERVGTAPVVLKVFGDRDGTFHNFGSVDFLIVAWRDNDPARIQKRLFHTGYMGEAEDKIPLKIFFDFARMTNSVTP